MVESKYEGFPVSIEDAIEELRDIVKELRANPQDAALALGLPMTRIVQRVVKLNATIDKLEAAKEIVAGIKDALR